MDFKILENKIFPQQDKTEDISRSATGTEFLRESKKFRDLLTKIIKDNPKQFNLDRNFEEGLQIQHGFIDSLE